MGDSPANTDKDARRQKFERVLALEPFTGLKAILDKLSRDRGIQCEAVSGAASYEDLLSRLGHRITLTKQIHVQDAFSRVGPEGGVRDVIPYYDIPTQSSRPTVINLDSTVTTTPESAAFFNKMLAVLKAQLAAAQTVK